MNPSKRALSGYAIAEAGIVAAEVLIQLYLLKFYTDVVGLRSDFAGYALALAVVWDAVSDPWMGAISDRTRFGSGRRRMYILAGGILLGLTLPLLFNPPELDSQAAKFGFLLFSYILVNTSTTILAVPHSAFGGELSSDSKTRTLIVGFRLLFGNVGLLAGTLLPGLILATGRTQPDPKSLAALWLAIPVGLSGFITFVSTRGLDRPGNNSGEWNVLGDVTGLRKNRPFLILFCALLVATIGRTVNSSLALFYYDRRLHLSEQDVVLYVLGLFILTISFSIPFWVWMSAKMGKIPAAAVGILLLGLMTTIGYPLFPAYDLRGPLMAAFIGGIAVGSIVLLESLLADIVDFDRLKSGKRREGLYFGVWKMGAKASRAIGLALSGILLQWTGIDSGSIGAAIAISPEETGFRLALLFGPFVGMFFLAGAALLLLLPYGRVVHERVQALLARRETRRAAP
ncbi:MAG: MFS transporter [Spirochaetia bacterium]|nr:MFS transporter [Spirochaetia bacterium]